MKIKKLSIVLFLLFLANHQHVMADDGADNSSLSGKMLNLWGNTKAEVSKQKEAISTEADKKLVEIIEKFSRYKDVMSSAGFSVKKLLLTAGINPRLSAYVSKIKEISQTEKESLYKRIDDEMLTNILNSLFSAYEYKITGYKVESVRLNIYLFTLPSTSVELVEVVL